MRAAILAIGDELVTGSTTDTNSGYLAQSLRSIGVDVSGFFTVADDEDAIAAALRRALEDAELIVTTGGLGPTSDDLTTASIARLAGLPLDLDTGSLAAMEDRFRSRHMEMPPNNRKQALFPRGSTILPNPSGTAPGFICDIVDGSSRRHIASLPGVPREMRRIVEESLLPWLAERSDGRVFGSRIFSVVGLTESKMDGLLEGAVDPDEARLSFRAAFPRMQARVTVSALTKEEVETRLTHLERAIRERLGASVYAMGDVALEEVIGGLLREGGHTLSVAESCTGGLIGHRITNVPGSSDYFLLGAIAYANEMKSEILGVREATLAEHGAVSEAVVGEMATGIRRAAGASIGLSTSGIAGPGGGSIEKPVGTICIGIASDVGMRTFTHSLGDRSRGWIKDMTAQLALDHLRRMLIER